MLIKSTYSEVRNKMKPGDVIAFGGASGISEIIKWATKGVVSHVGVVLQTKAIFTNDNDPRFFNQIIESDKHGVTIGRMSDRIDNYNGEIWWLPLSNEARSKLNVAEFFNFLLKQKGKSYDTPQALRAALDQFDNINNGLSHLTKNEEDFSKFFCSELVSAALEAGEVINSINSSEVTPIDICKFKLFSVNYYQLKGKHKDIKGINMLDPENWGE